VYAPVKSFFNRRHKLASADIPTCSFYQADRHVPEMRNSAAARLRQQRLQSITVEPEMGRGLQKGSSASPYLRQPNQFAIVHDNFVWRQSPEAGGAESADRSPRLRDLSGLLDAHECAVHAQPSQRVEPHEAQPAIGLHDILEDERVPEGQSDVEAEHTGTGVDCRTTRLTADHGDSRFPARLEIYLGQWLARAEDQGRSFGLVPPDGGTSRVPCERVAEGKVTGAGSDIEWYGSPDIVPDVRVEAPARRALLVHR
jgi:hypothetical protein